MDTFDLNWPKTQATFYTDGWRCRIVWRQQGGPGGTIDNHGLCKRRLADSLSGAPYLLSALRARGYGTLAEEIEGLVEAAPTAEPAAASRREKAATVNVTVRRAEPVPAKAHEQSIAHWIAGLEGDATFAETGARRAKVWFDLGRLAEEHLFLKEPASRGKSEWVLKRTWPESDRKAEYVAAPYLRGLFSYLCGRTPRPREADIETLLRFAGEIVHPQIAQAAHLWKNSRRPATH